LKAGFDPKKIIFTANTKSREELKLAISKKIVVNLDSEDELAQVDEVAGGVGKTARISFRVNPGITGDTHANLQTGKKESKFGIAFERAVGAYKQALSRRNVRVVGLHMHIGSQILRREPFCEAAEKIVALAGDLKSNGVHLEFIDLGGGLGIRYKEEHHELDPAEVADKVMPIVIKGVEKAGLKNLEIRIEPGRFIVGEAGILLTRMQTTKQGVYKKFVSVDAGFNTLARPVMYDAYHEVVLASNVEGSLEQVDIAGNVCESGDILAKDRKIPKAKEGEIIAFLCAGAYGFSMSSRYNSRPLPAEVLVRDGKDYLIREKETLKDLLRGQKIV